MELRRDDVGGNGRMIATAGALAIGLGLMVLKGFGLFLMVLGAIDLHGHIKEREGKR